MKLMKRFLAWLVSGDGGPWALYFLFLIAFTAAAVCLLVFTDLGVTTTEIHKPPESGGEVLLTERRRETSIPVVAVVTALTAGGWMVIPLKWLWDERTKRNAAAREETKAKADHRREVSLNMRARIHGYVEQYYAPDMYRMAGVKKWAERLKQELDSGAKRKTKTKTTLTLYRLLYWLGRYHAHCIRCDDAAVPLLFRTIPGERVVEGMNLRLRELLSVGFGEMVEGDFVLARAVLPERKGGANASTSPLGETPLNEVDFIEFRRRIEPASGAKWDALRELCGKLEEHFTDPQRLAVLIWKADETRETYRKYINKVYREWYESEPGDSGLEAKGDQQRPAKDA